MRYMEVDTPSFRHRPERILQFGEGNFLRAFVDWMINSINENSTYSGSVVICQPIATGLADLINQQHGEYHVAMRGIENGEPVERIKKITSVSRCINPYQDFQAFLDIAKSDALQVVVSNTTEAGICYDPNAKMGNSIPDSFPAKVTVLLYERFKAFHGAADKGLLFLPVELIDNNGAELKKIVLRHGREWGLGEEFLAWVDHANKFTSTLVDRIVTGYPRSDIAYFDELLGKHDPLMDTCELFNLWVIEGKKAWMDILPLHKGSGNVIWTDNVTPYKKRKVRILNGAHTSTVLAAYLAGCDIVLDVMHDPALKTFMETLIYQEVIPTLDLPKEELLDFAGSIHARFSNPYIKHKLLDISLNSCSKFEARCLPTILDYIQQTGSAPRYLCFAFAAFLKFYQVKLQDGQYYGTRAKDGLYPVKDSPQVLAFFAKAWENQDSRRITDLVLSNTALWHGQDLTQLPGLADAVAAQLEAIEKHGIRSAISALLAEQAENTIVTC